jgi:hypothetical protein
MNWYLATPEALAADALRPTVEVWRKRVADLERERDEALARAEATEAREAGLRSTLTGIAQGDRLGTCEPGNDLRVVQADARDALPEPEPVPSPQIAQLATPALLSCRARNCLFEARRWARVGRPMPTTVAELLDVPGPAIRRVQGMGRTTRLEILEWLAGLGLRPVDGWDRG